MDWDWGPDEGQWRVHGRKSDLFLHCWGMKDVRISLSPFYFVVTIHRPAELQWSLGHMNRGIKAKADSRVWGEGSREKKTGHGVV